MIDFDTLIPEELQPFLKHLALGISLARYDLWVARPMDITQPPRLK